jgi:hypothetical protein
MPSGGGRPEGPVGSPERILRVSLRVLRGLLLLGFVLGGNVGPMSSGRAEDDQRLFRLAWVPLLLVGPLGAVAIGAPLAWLPFYPDPRGLTAPYTLIAAPFYVAVIAAPGFLVGLFVKRRTVANNVAVRLWVRTSLPLGLVSGLAALWATRLMVLFGPPAVASIASTLVYWQRFERAATTPIGSEAP